MLLQALVILRRQQHCRRPSLEPSNHVVHRIPNHDQAIRAILQLPGLSYMQNPGRVGFGGTELAGDDREKGFAG